MKHIKRPVKRRVVPVINDAKIKAEEKPGDRVLYAKWRRTCIERGFAHIAGFEPADRVQVLVRKGDPWEQPWFARVLEVIVGPADTCRIKVSPINNMITLRPGFQLDEMLTKGIWVSGKNAQLIENASA